MPALQVVLRTIGHSPDLDRARAVRAASEDPARVDVAAALPGGPVHRVLVGQVALLLLAALLVEQHCT